VIPFYDRTVQRTNPLQALTGICVIADNIPNADMSFAALIGSVVEHNFKRLEIGVNVGEYRKTHRAPQYGTEQENSLRFCV
jgi:hypothetical protein